MEGALEWRRLRARLLLGRRVPMGETTGFLSDTGMLMRGTAAAPSNSSASSELCSGRNDIKSHIVACDRFSMHSEDIVCLSDCTGAPCYPGSGRKAHLCPIPKTLYKFMLLQMAILLHKEARIG